MLAPFVSAAVSLSVVLTLQVAGADTSVDPRGSRTVVLVTVSEDDAVLAAMRGQLTEIGIELGATPMKHWSRALHEQVAGAEELARQRSALAVVWVEGREDGVATLYLYDAYAGAAFARELPWSGSVAASAEAVALVTRRAVEGLIQGHPAGMRPLELPQLEEPATLDIEPPPKPPRHRVRVHAAYLGVNFSPAVPWHSGAMVALGWQSPWGLYAVAGYQAFGPIRASDAIAELELRRHPIDVAVGFRWSPKRVGVEAEISGILDVLASRTTSNSAGVRTADALVLEPGVGARVRADYAPLPWLRFPLGVGVEVFPRAAPFVTSAPERSVLVAPQVVRFRFDAGVALLF